MHGAAACAPVRAVDQVSQWPSSLAAWLDVRSSTTRRRRRPRLVARLHQLPPFPGRLAWNSCSKRPWR